MKNMTKFADFKKELAEKGIKLHFFLGRIVLERSDEKLFSSEYQEEYLDVSPIVNDAAFIAYKVMIKQNPEFEAWLIQEWSKEDTRTGQAVKFAIDERIAIQEAEGLQPVQRTAILSMVTE